MITKQIERLIRQAGLDMICISLCLSLLVFKSKTEEHKQLFVCVMNIQHH